MVVESRTWFGFVPFPLCLAHQVNSAPPQLATLLDRETALILPWSVVVGTEAQFTLCLGVLDSRRRSVDRSHGTL